MSLCAHYGVEASRNNPALAHKNGSIAGPRNHLKAAVADALLLRGSQDFVDLAIYRSFVEELW